MANGTPSNDTSRPGPSPLFTDSPNARSRTITTAAGPYTHGILNQHPSSPTSYSIGVSCDTGSRRTMEDAHSFVADFAGVRGQGYWAVFDGHAGKHAAEWCGTHFHEYFLDALEEMQWEDSHPPQNSQSSNRRDSPGRDIPTGALIPDVLNKTFHAVDEELSRIADKGQTHSGCTAVTAFLRLEDDRGWQPPAFVRNAKTLQRKYAAMSSSFLSTDDASAKAGGETLDASKGSGIVSNVQEFGGTTEPSSLYASLDGTPEPFSSPAAPLRPPSQALSLSSGQQNRSSRLSTSAEFSVDDISPVYPEAKKRVLYTANAGDARAVLSRAGKAVRLTYDHKGSDAQEAKRIKEAGGFVMNNRVNGVLAVTRSLGDSAMKEFVVGSPYTTETTLGDDDDLLIIACDGLWDVIDDQTAVDLIRPVQDPQTASKKLVEYAISHYSSDNISVIVVRFHHAASNTASAISTTISNDTPIALG